MPMILDKIRARYDAAPARLQTGNPTGSQWGRCAARLQMLRFPERSHPERLPMRARMVMEMGHLVEDWWRGQVAAVYPDKLGLAQEPFFLPVPLERDDARRVERMIQQRTLWGAVRPDFERPYVRRDPMTGRVKMRLFHGGRDQRKAQDGERRDPGFILDPDAETLYAPAYVDNIVDDEEIGLAVLEAKALSNYGFRRALVGSFDREKRMQLAGTWAAIGLPVCWLLYRKETAHIAQVLYVPAERAGMTEVRYLTGNGVQRVEYVRGVASGASPGDAEWETAQTWTPYEPGILPEIQAHIRRVLFYEPDGGAPWHREYGPSFSCGKCAGGGALPCGACKGTGRTPTGKEHKVCAGAGRRPCGKCAGAGALETTELRYPCSYAITPDTPILLSDYSWLAAAKVAPGMEVIGVTEEPNGRRHRTIAHGTVEHVIARRAPVLRLVTANGTVRCSPEHPWLVRRPSKGRAHWRPADGIRPGCWLAWLTTPTATDPETEAYMGGYIRGLIDGDGSAQARRAETPTVRVAMADLEPLERLTRYLQYFGLQTTIDTFTAFSRRAMWQVAFGGVRHDRHEVVRRLIFWPLAESDAAAGYLGGMFDAEGSFERGVGRASLRIHQVMGGAVDATIRHAVEILGLPLQAERWRKGRGAGSYRLTGASLTSAIARFFTVTRPAIAQKRALVGQPIRNCWVRVEDVVAEPEQEVIDLSVAGSRTFVAGGLVSHNCPVVHFCYPMATLTLDKRPHYTITRADWTKAGLQVFPADAEPIEEDEETTVAAAIAPGTRADETESEEA